MKRCAVKCNTVTTFSKEKTYRDEDNRIHNMSNRGKRALFKDKREG